MLLFWLFGTGLIILFLRAGFSYQKQDNVPRIIRPTLQGEHLEQWTKLYGANCALYQRLSIEVTALENLTWEQYNELTGNAEWIDNPQYTALEQEI